MSKEDNMYSICKEFCEKFKNEEKLILANADSVFDAVIDMRLFVDSCSKTSCQIIAKANAKSIN